MEYSFKRSDEIDLGAFAKQIGRQYEALEWLLGGAADAEEVYAYARAVLESGRGSKGMPGGLFWGYDELQNLPADARIDFYYVPTYLNTAFLMQAYRVMPQKMEAIPGFTDGLSRAMKGSAGRGFTGLGYDKGDFVQGMQIFASVHAIDFIRKHKDLVPETFASRYRAAIWSIECDIFDEEDYLRRVEKNREGNYLKEYGRILEAELAGRHRLFVYGSLMKGQYNHTAFLSDAEYLGKASIRGFGLYDLGSYPGIKYAEDVFSVTGELYAVDEDTYEEVCSLEGNGFLYQNETTAAFFEKKKESIREKSARNYRNPGFSVDWIPAEVFVYLGMVDESMRVPGTVQSWVSPEDRAKMEGKYVWYACYGSNINRARFMRYINICADKTPPVEDRPYEFEHPVFFAGQSGLWEGKGIAFLDAEVSGHAYGKIYKITEEQYQTVSEWEGPNYARKLEFGLLEGIPVVSFTCQKGFEPDRNAPSLKYLDTILNGMRETYPESDGSAMAKELTAGIFTAEELRVLDCLQQAVHSASNREIAEATGLTAEEVKRAVLSLLGLGMIRQDRKSREYPVDDDCAAFFTVLGERYLIDIILGLHAQE